MPRDASMDSDSKFHRRFENIMKTNLANFGKVEVPPSTFLQQNLENRAILTEINGFYELGCFSTIEFMIDSSFDCAQ